MTKLITSHNHDIDKQINKFLEENSVSLVDVKFNTIPYGSHMFHSALIIYNPY